MLKRVLCVLLFMVAIGVSLGYAQTQTPTTQGTDFWLSYMRNGHRDSSFDQLTLIVSSKNNCQVTMSNADFSWTERFSVSAGVVVIKEVPDIRGYNDQVDGISSKGIHVTSTDTISLYIGNESQNSYDAANVLPTSALGTSYVIQTFESVLNPSSIHASNMRASFLVVATEDNTVVQITPKVATGSNHPAGVTYPISLNRGQVYHVMTLNGSTTGNANGDFSGTIVEADKPIAVFNGNCLVSIPGGLSSGYDQVFEQAMPVDNWGKRFVVTSIYPCYGDLQADQVKITALNDNTTVQRDGAVLCTLQACESYTFSVGLNASTCYLESDNPIAVYLYNHSHGSGDNAHGDPSMVWISPVEQTIEEVTFSTFQVQQVSVHYANIVCFTKDVDYVILDGVNIASSFSAVPGNPELSYARKNISHHSHTLRCPGGFIAYVYGIGEAEGYAYTVGSSAKTLTKQLYVDDILSTNLPNGYTVCQNNPPIQFRTEFNYDFDRVSWDFGDGTFGEGQEVSHEYAATGHYDVEAVVYRDLDKTVQPFDTLSVTVHVNPLLELSVGETSCEPTYTFRGETYDVPFFGDVMLYGDEGCDTICHLNIMQGPSISYTTYDTACMVYMWFDTLLNESNTYVKVLHQEGGCDSLYILHLTIGQPPEKTERHKTSCDSYLWDNRLLCDTTGTYRLSFTTNEYCVYDSVLYFERVTNEPVFMVTDTCDQYEWMGNLYSDIGFQTDTIDVNENGCNRQYIMNLTLHESPPFEEILGLSNVAVATSYWPGEYNYYLDDSTGMDTNSIRWELLDNPAGPGFWELKPHGASCTVMAYSMGMKTLRVTSNNGSCDKEAFKTIHCSGYAIDENDSMDLEIFPNPVKDELMIKGGELLEVTLFNLLGQKVLSVLANGKTSLSVEVGHLPPTLYLLEVRTMKGNKTQLISVIN